MKILGFVILAGFFGLLGVIFIVYVFKLFLRCREKIRLAAEFKKKDFEELVARPSSEDGGGGVLVKVIANGNPNPLSKDKDLAEDSEFLSVQTHTPGGQSHLSPFTKPKNQKQHPLLNCDSDEHIMSLNNSVLAYSSIIKIPRIELSACEVKNMKAPEVLIQVHSTDDIRKIQKETWNIHRKSNSHAGIKELGCNIVIAVCTMEKSIGGIYLNLEKKYCQQYSYAVECLPWEEKWGESQKELEMKNLLFALLLWESEIVAAKTFRCYTGTDYSSTCFSSDSFHGSQVTSFLEHLTECEEAILVDSNVMVNRNECPKEFAQYIQPAEDLITCKQDLSEKHIRKIYGIKEFVSSHVFQTSKDGPDKNSYAPSSYYNFLLDTVYKRCRKWNETPCPICDFRIKK